MSFRGGRGGRGGDRGGGFRGRGGGGGFRGRGGGGRGGFGVSFHADTEAKFFLL